MSRGGSSVAVIISAISLADCKGSFETLNTGDSIGCASYIWNKYITLHIRLIRDFVGRRPPYNCHQKTNAGKILGWVIKKCLLLILTVLKKNFFLWWVLVAESNHGELLCNQQVQQKGGVLAHWSKMYDYFLQLVIRSRMLLNSEDMETWAPISIQAKSPMFECVNYFPQCQFHLQSEKEKSDRTRQSVNSNILFQQIFRQSK